MSHVAFASKNLRQSVVAILTSEGRVAGTGFLVAKEWILTCAHVVKAAAGGPNAELQVRFPTGETKRARVDSEVSRPFTDDDVAFLQPIDPWPRELEPLTLCTDYRSTGQRFRTFGYPRVVNVMGLWATGEIKGLVTTGERQLLQLASPDLAKGMSGSPVVAEAGGQVVAMVSAVVESNGKHRDTGFAIPAGTLALACAAILPCPEILANAVSGNPFRVDGRINDPGLFFGRQRLIRELRGELKKRTNVALVGESQIGKSSLLYYLYQTRADWLPEPEVALEYLDLQRVMDEEDFCETVLHALGEAGQTLRELKRALELSRIVLLLDEVERLAEPDFNPRLHDLLRSLAQEPHFALCVATRRPLVEVFPAQTAGRLSEFPNIFIHKELGPFSDAEAREFLCQRLALTGVPWREEEIEELVRESGGHPAELQRRARDWFITRFERGEGSCFS